MDARPPRVLFLADKFGFPGGVLHGGSTYFLEVLPALAERGVDLTTCFLREPHPAAEALHRFGIRPTFLSAPRLSPLVLFPVLKLIRKHRCEVVHAAGYASTVTARLAARLTSTRTILHVHHLQDPGRIVRLIQRRVSAPTDVGLAVSLPVRDMLIDAYSVGAERARVLHNGLSLDRFLPRTVEESATLRRSLGVSRDAPVIGMIARLYPVKGHQAMIRMMPRIVSEHPDALLLVVGDGPERPACESLAAALGLPSHVKFLGQRSDVADLLSICDVTVIPSESEGLPMGAIESLAMSRPVIAYAVGGLPEVVDDGITGHLIAPGDASAFAEAMVSLLGDSRRLAAFSSAARSAAERFSLHRHVTTLVELYHELATTEIHSTRDKESRT